MKTDTSPTSYFKLYTMFKIHFAKLKICEVGFKHSPNLAITPNSKLTLLNLVIFCSQRCDQYEGILMIFLISLNRHFPAFKTLKLFLVSRFFAIKSIGSWAKELKKREKKRCCLSEKLFFIFPLDCWFSTLTITVWWQQAPQLSGKFWIRVSRERSSICRTFSGLGRNFRRRFNSWT